MNLLGNKRGKQHLKPQKPKAIERRNQRSKSVGASGAIYEVYPIKKKKVGN